MCADRDSSRTKTFVSSLSSWSSAAGQLDALAGFQTNTHSIQMESMKHVYMQAKAALQQGISPDHCVSGYRLSAFKLQTKPSTAGWKIHGTSSSQQDKKSTFLALHPFGNEHVVGKGSMMNDDQSEKLSHQQNRQIDLQRNSMGAPSQDRSGIIPTEHGSSIINPLFKEETPTSFPSSSNGVSKKFDDTNLFALHDEATRKHPNSESSRSSNFKLFLEPVDSLHVEIQQLQARILERIRSSASLNMASQNLYFLKF